MAVHHIRDVVPYAVNFGLVVVLLAAVARKPLRKFIYQRHERMKDAFESAALAFQKAEGRARLARAAMQSLSQEAAGLLSRERAQAEIEKKEIFEKSQREAERVIAEAGRLAQVEQDDASLRVKGEFLSLVVAEAEQSLKKGLKKDDHAAILNRAKASIEVGV